MENAGLRPIPTFADMEAMGKKKIWPKKLAIPASVSDEDLLEDAMVEIVQLVRENIKLAENEKI
jgi:hypothetical protein